MELKVYRLDGTETGRTVALDPSIFGVEPNNHAIWLDVRSIQAAARQGTHKTKGRSETAGSTRKLYRQKGTGGARAGDAKSPTRRSGGTMFGPKPHKYRVEVNKKVKRLARRSAYTYKLKRELIKVVEDIRLEQPSTKAVVRAMRALGIGEQRVLLLTPGTQVNVWKSARNVPGYVVKPSTVASTLDVMRARFVLIQESALAPLTAVLGQSAPADEAAE